MPLTLPFDTTYLALPERFHSKVEAAPASAPELIAFNHDLAAELGLDTEDMTDNEAANIFSGNSIPDNAITFAQVYAGHQFGGFSPRLGDGRALHLGEVNGPAGRVDIQLKGSGPTPGIARTRPPARCCPYTRCYLSYSCGHVPVFRRRAGC